MKQGILILAALMTLMAECHGAPTPTHVMTKIHTVSIHVKDHSTHESVYRFLREDLELPLVYEPVTQGNRRYVGLWAGNLVLEPCGPYTNINYATPDFKAMFCGLTFEAYTASKQSSQELDNRGISHNPLGSFVIITDSNLVTGNLVASIMDNPGRVQERQKHKALTSQLKEHQGGPLGVQYVKEVEIGYTDPQDVDAWQTLLAPYRQISPKQWQLSEGPAIRLLKSDIKEIKSVVFIVTSLEAAVQYLKSQDLLGPVDKNGVHVKVPDDWEFKIILQE